MNFISLQYFVFFIFVFSAYWHLSRKNQNIFLLLSSWFFYANWDWRFLSLILISTIIDYVSGKKIYDNNSLKIKRLWLTISLVTNLSILAYFKYANFFIDSFISFTNNLGFSVAPTTLNVILPVGISFYTFQSLSYSLDIYRNKLKPSNSLINFATFVAFFPQLVAGPIVRAKEFLYQLEVDRQFSGSDFESGIIRFLKGFFKKAFIADGIAIYLVDPVFSNPESYSSGMLWLAMFGYAVQIYADFSGYSDMAIGSARMLGFKLPENFNFPYLATSFSDFWQRWHMTMSRFFRDYVYIALGGNRVGPVRHIANLSVTTLISGLWHGAGWNFVLWGGLHGVYIAINHIMSATLKKNKPVACLILRLTLIPRWLSVQLFVCFAWVLFRSSSLSDAMLYLERMFLFEPGEQIILNATIYLCFTAFFIDHLYGWIKEHHVHIYEYFDSATLGIQFKATIYTCMVLFLFYFIPEGAAPFIYFQF